MYGIPINRVEQIEEIATEAWLRYCGGRLPVAIRDITIGNNIQLHRMEADSEFDAVFDLSGRPPYDLYLRNRKADENTTAYKRRFRFTEAHELGHFFLHYNVPIVHRETPKTIEDAVADGNFTLAEIEIDANCFAGALVMPKNAFKDDLEASEIQGGERWMDSLVRKYDVSYGALDRRVARLRSGLVITGYAWADSGRIISMIPSMDLEYSEPIIAKEGWRRNPNVRNHLVGSIPSVLMADVRSQLGRLPNRDMAVMKVERDKVPLSDVLPEVKDANGSVYICGCYRNQRQIYFEIELN